MMGDGIPVEVVAPRRRIQRFHPLHWPVAAFFCFCAVNWLGFILQVEIAGRSAASGSSHSSLVKVKNSERRKKELLVCGFM